MKAYSTSLKPLHTRAANFGTVYIGANNKTYALDTSDLLCSFISELDERGVYLTTSAERHAFLMEMYVTKVLGLNLRDDFSLIESNNVEDLSHNTEYYRTMQQYTILPIWDLYKLTWDKFIEQPWVDIQFQLKMARKFKESTATHKPGELESIEREVMLDESHIAKVAAEEPQFKRNF